METAREIADAVLYEGRPLRAGAVKDRVRRQFGVFVPPGFTAAEEPSSCQTECLVEGGDLVHVRSRFLHLRTRDGAEPFEEAAAREIDHVWPLEDLLAGEQVRDTRIPGGRETVDGATRTWQPLDVRVRASAERLPGPYGVVRLRLRLENTGGWTGEDRAEALRHSLVAAHSLIGLTGGRFVSLADPPEWARPAVDGCENLRTWPVLIEDDVVLSAPILLADRPRGRHADVPVFTTEKSWWDPGVDASVSPETDRITVAGHEVGKGSKVRLRPTRRADAQDMFVAGRVATVEAVLFDVDGSQHLAVTIDDDPGTDLRRAQGRYWYFAPDDVEPL